jgi:hypothetical protein
VAQKESQGPRSEKLSLSSQAPADFAAAAKQHFEEFTSAQTELWDIFQETNRQWLDRMQAEANLASEFASKLTGAKSIPDAMTACQEWGNRHFEMMAEDAKHAMDATEKFMRAGAHIVANGLRIERP